MTREFIGGIKFTDIPWQSTSSLWGDESDQPADLDTDFSATPGAETVKDFLFKKYKTLDELG